jgi:translation elongation factor EF-Ts
MITVYIILGLAALCAVLGLITGVQARRVKKYEQENAAMRVAMHDAAARLEHVYEYIRKNNLVEEEANAQRQELSNTDDAGLASRANALFGSGVRDKPDGGNRRT